MPGKSNPDIDQMIEGLQNRKAMPQRSILDTFIQMLYPRPQATPMQLPRFDEAGNPIQQRTLTDVLQRR